VTILKQPERSLTEKSLAALGTTAKVVCFPITLLIYLIVESLSQLAASQGLGTDQQVRNIDALKREKLRAMGGEEIKFGMTKETVLEGMFFESDPIVKNPKPKAILLCTGSHQSYEHYAIPMVKELKAMGHNVMVFNYEGFGQSQGKRSEEGVYRSVEAAYQYLKQEKNCSDDSIIAWGYSLGSGAVSDLTAKHSVDVVIDRGFSSMSEFAYKAAPDGLKTIAKIIFMIGAYFNNIDKLANTQARVFVAQGTQDATMIAEKHGQKLQQVLSQNPNAFYKEINSPHHHTDEQVWFSKDPERAMVQEFLSK
jgi:alpha/beta superfamily hydrolase